ncbi:MAG: hypothetical protein HYV07_19420 [Deltaproteobacteria bacterium]|nr:hypothetical protein [Deltaproteobacteria bacterium]
MRAEPLGRAVLHGEDPSRSDLVRLWDDGSVEVRAAIRHAPGRVPAAAFDGETTYVVRDLGGERGAELLEHRPDLASPKVIARHVLPLAPPIVRPGSVAFTIVGDRIDRGPRLALERLAVVARENGALRAQLEAEAFLLWPFATRRSSLLVLVADPEGTRIVEVASDRGLRRVCDFGPAQVRDPAMLADGRTLTLVERLGRRSRLLSIDLDNPKVRTLAEVVGDEVLLGMPVELSSKLEPYDWAPPNGRAESGRELGFFFSISPSWNRGRARVSWPGSSAMIPLPDGSPIPLAAAGPSVLVRVQSESGHRHFLVRATHEGQKLTELRTRGGVLSSVRLEAVK